MITEVKFDCNLEFPPIVEPLYAASPEELEEGGDFGMQQTKVTGVIAPLIKLNNTTINFSQVKYMELSCKRFPKISLVIVDSMGLSTTYDKPNADNILQLQILPPFDNAYRKINLCFIIKELNIDGDMIRVEGIYNIPGWNDSVMKSYGYSSTCEFFENIAHELKLGFASNLENTDDARWIYIPNNPRFESLESETEFGGNERQILDYWVDFWNCINLVDIYERYNTVDEDIRVWASNSRYPKIDAIDNIEPEEIEAMISNHQNMKMSPLFCTEFEQISNFANNISEGSDKVCEVYNMASCDTDVTYIMDENIKKNVIVRYDYMGEEFGDVNYLTNKMLHNAYTQKLNSQQIKVVLQQPCFGFYKGGKVNFYWYEVNELTKKEKNKVLESNIDLPEDVTQNDQDMPLINGEVSGQYYISDVIFTYENSGNVPKWRQEMTLSRPAQTIDRYVTEEDRPLDKSSFGKPAELPKTQPNKNSSNELATKTIDIFVEGVDKMQKVLSGLTQSIPGLSESLNKKIKNIENKIK